MSDNLHISKSDFYAFQHDFMNQKEKELFLEHICSCDFCSDQFTALMSEEIIAAPRDMKANILKATMRPDIQLAARVRETSKQMQLLIYSLKVGAATLGALLLLIFSMNYTHFTNAPKVTEDISSDASADEEPKASLTSTIRDSMDNFTDSMLDFSNNIIKTEGSDHDQKEK